MNSVPLRFNQFPNSLVAMKSEFCITNPKRIMDHHRHRLRNPIFIQKKFWCVKVKAPN